VGAGPIESCFLSGWSWPGAAGNHFQIPDQGCHEEYLISSEIGHMPESLSLAAEFMNLSLS
jgi:hypothetical protein